MSSKGKILVVDDDRLVLATLTHGLSQAGFDVLDADNGDDAILLARQHRPGLALLDIRMEGLSGFDVAAYLREHLQIPFMFLSAFADEETVEKVKTLGAVAYLIKPLDIGQIVPTLKAAFANQPLPLAAAVSAVQAAPVQPADGSGQQAWHIAIGMLMQRDALSRQQAMARLERLASAEQRSPAEQAIRLIEAWELRLSQGQHGQDAG